jgi:predicted GNAT superfamily acetyltransferase
VAAGGGRYPRGQAQRRSGSAHRRGRAAAAKVCGVATHNPTSAETEVARAAARAGVRVELLGSPEAAAEVADLFVEIWETSHRHAPMSPDLLSALSFTDQYVALARGEDGTVLAGSVGFLGADENGIHLHSHITGVRPEAQGRRIGYALKLHQRAWAASHGLATITWTFDPLVRRNAYFNLTRLGAVPTRYVVNAYGEMADGLNAGEPSDRFLVAWPVAPVAPHVPPDRGEAAVVLAGGPGGEPVATAPGDAPVRCAWVPEDIVELRRRDAPLARTWRLALRDAIAAAGADGYTATAMTRDGWYVLERRA